MKNKEAEEKLFSEFPSVSREEWEALITSDLKGADYRERLKWNTLEGISPLPFYMREDTNRVPPIFSAKSWTHCEPVFDQEPSQIRQTIELAYQRGSRAFQITSKLTSSRSDEDGSHTIQLYGSKITDQESFDLLFENTDTKKISLYFDTGTLSPLFSAMVKNHPQPFQRAVFFYDPITESIASGLKLRETDEDFGTRVRQAENLTADALFYHKAGCTIVSEAAIAISILSEYLSAIPEGQRETAARSFVIRVSAGPLYFPEIAKFRALRLLWKNLLEAYGLDTSIPAEIHAETTMQNKSASDPHNNMLRVTTEAMAAATGGADSLTIYPYDASFSRPDNFSTRIAGNVHHILKEESHLNKTADPSAGSYYIENLTRDIAEKAWKEFAESESKGGFLKYIQSGDLGKKINASRSAKENAYATRKRVLTGNNHYPNTQENLSVSPEKTQPFPKSTITGAGKEGNGAEKNYAASEFQKKLNNGHTLSTLLPSVILSGDQSEPLFEEFNAASIFDSIRRKTEELANKTGKEAKILILPAGNLKWRNARASFAQNLLGCGGFKLLTAEGGNTLQEALDKLTTDDFDAAVLCSSDQEYPDMAGRFCKYLANGKRVLILAGQPGENEQLYRNQGVHEFIWAGMNAAEFLSGLQSEIYTGSTSS